MKGTPVQITFLDFAIELLTSKNGLHDTGVAAVLFKHLLIKLDLDWVTKFMTLEGGAYRVVNLPAFYAEVAEQLFPLSTAHVNDDGELIIHTGINLKQPAD